MRDNFFEGYPIPLIDFTERGLPAMEPTEKDIIAALLKIVRESELIPEATYRAALGRLFCTFDVSDESIKKGGVVSVGW